MFEGTMDLFLKEPDPRQWFKKTAAISRMPDDEKKWPAHLLSEIHKQLPFMSSYDVDISLDRIDPEAGYGMGYAAIRNKTVRSPQDDVGRVTNRMKIPVIIEDRQLKPFHTFELGGNIYPLTKDRVESAMLNPAIFDAPAQRLPASPSLVDQLYPPYQQRQGFGRVVEYDSASGIMGASGNAKTGSGLASFIRSHLSR